VADQVRFGLKLSQQVHPIDAQRDARKIADQARVPLKQVYEAALKATQT